jgi:hypothetical protein
MKKYIQPSIEVVDLETSGIMTGSDGSTLNIYKNQESDVQLQGRKRGDAWSEYEGL